MLHGKHKGVYAMTRGKKFSLFLISFLVLSLFCFQITNCHAEKYAVLVGAGTVYVDDIQGYSEVWYDLFLFYETLIQQGYTHEHIYVLYGNGEDFVDTIHDRYKVSYQHSDWPISKITDYDNRRETIINFTGWLRNTITSDDDLIFWWLGHAYSGATNTCPDVQFAIDDYELIPGINPYHPTIPAWTAIWHREPNVDYITDDELQEYLDMDYNTRCIFFAACRSGGMVDELENDRTIIMTDTQCELLSDSQQYDVFHNEFNYHLYCALNGADPTGDTEKYASEITRYKFGQIIWGMDATLDKVYSYIQRHMSRTEAQFSDIGGLADSYSIFNLHSDAFLKVDKTHITFNEANVFENIQSAINVANDNKNVIIVAEATYYERITITNKNIILIGLNGETETTINGGNSGRVITIDSTSAKDVQIAGFTITDGDVSPNNGGGIYCNKSELTIYNCTVKGNSAKQGGGIFVTAPSSFFANCSISDNEATDGEGGGIYSNYSNSNIKMSNCVIVDNSAKQGCCLSIRNAKTGTFMNCTIAGNDAAPGAVNPGAVYIYSPNYELKFTNCIIWNDTTPEIKCTGKIPIIDYSDINDNSYQGKNNSNIHEDPLFINPGADDYHLQIDSNCIDGGTFTEGVTPNDDRDGFFRPINIKYDMGAYEFIQSFFTAGLNLFVPGYDCGDYDSYDMLNELGQGYVASISCRDPVSGIVKTTYWFFGRPTGDRFQIETDQVYYVDMKEEKRVVGSPCLANIYLYLLNENPNFFDKARAKESVDSSYVEDDVKRVLYRKIDEWLPDPIDQQSSDATSSIEGCLPEEIWQQRVTAGTFGRLSKVNVYVSSPGTAKFFVNLGGPWQTDNHDFETTVSSDETGWISIDTYSANINLHPGDQYVIGFQGVMGLPQAPWMDNENGTLYTNIAWNYTMGYRFTPVRDGRITMLGGYFNGTKTVSLWDSSGTKLTSATVTSSNNWSYTDITPVYVTAGQTYTVGVYLAGYGGSRRSGVQPAFPRTHGDITIQGSCYNYGDAYPVVVVSSYMYGQADIAFEPIESLGIYRSDSSAYIGGELWSGPSSQHPDYDLAFQTYIMPGQPSIQTPWKDNGNGTLYKNYNWYYTMGYRFTPVTDGYVTKLGGYFNGTKTVSLWDTSGTKLTNASVTSSYNWSYTDILPVAVKAGQTYTVAAYIAGSGGCYRYSVQPTFPRTHGDITIKGSCYASGNTYPVAVSSYYNMYGQVDIGFVASPLQTPWKDNQNGTLSTNQAWNYTLGYDFIPSVDGKITMLGGLFNGAKRVTIWDSNRNKLLVTTIASNNNWGYADVMPLTVKAGEKYTVAAYLAGSGGSYRYGIKAFPQQYGDIEIVCSRYEYGDTFPEYEYPWHMYGQVDIGFIPDCAPNPSGLTITQQAGLMKVDLNWMDNSNDEEGFKIERKRHTDDSWILIHTTGPGVTSYTDCYKKLFSGITYNYRVCATKAGDDSGYAQANVVLTAPPAATLHWTTLNSNIVVMSDIWSKDTYYSPSQQLDVDPDNNPGFAYRGVDGAYYYLHWNGTNWEGPEQVSAGNTGGWGKMTYDHNGNAHLVYNRQISGSNYDFFYRQRTATGWLAEERVCTTAGNSFHGSIDIDAMGRPYLVWTDESEVFRAAHFRYRQGPNNWMILGPTERLTSSSRYPSYIAVDDLMQPHVHSCGYISGIWRYCYRYWNGSSWAYRGGTEYISTDRAGYSTLAVDSQDFPHAAYDSNLSGNGEIYYRFWNGASWTDRVNVSNSAGGSGSSMIVIDSQNRPHIVWMDNTPGNNEIYYTYWDGDSWDVIGGSVNVSNTSSNSYAPALCLDYRDRPHICWIETNPVTGKYDMHYIYATQ